MIIKDFVLIPVDNRHNLTIQLPKILRIYLAKKRKKRGSAVGGECRGK